MMYTLAARGVNAVNVWCDLGCSHFTLHWNGVFQAGWYRCLTEPRGREGVERTVKRTLKCRKPTQLAPLVEGSAMIPHVEERVS